LAALLLGRLPIYTAFIFFTALLNALLLASVPCLFRSVPVPEQAPSFKPYMKRMRAAAHFHDAVCCMLSGCAAQVLEAGRQRFSRSNLPHGCKSPGQVTPQLGRLRGAWRKESVSGQLKQLTSSVVKRYLASQRSVFLMQLWIERTVLQDSQHGVLRIIEVVGHWLFEKAVC